MQPLPDIPVLDSEVRFLVFIIYMYVAVIHC